MYSYHKFPQVNFFGKVEIHLGTGQLCIMANTFKQWQDNFLNKIATFSYAYVTNSMKFHTLLKVMMPFFVN